MGPQCYRGTVKHTSEKAAQQLRALVLPEDLGSIPGTAWQLTAVCNSIPRGSHTLTQTYMQSKYQYTLKSKLKGFGVVVSWFCCSGAGDRQSIMEENKAEMKNAHFMMPKKEGKEWVGVPLSPSVCTSSDPTFLTQPHFLRFPLSPSISSG